MANKGKSYVNVQIEVGGPVSEQTAAEVAQSTAMELFRRSNFSTEVFSSCVSDGVPQTLSSQRPHTRRRGK